MHAKVDTLSENQKHFFDRYSAQVRSRLLFQREVDLASAGENKYYSKETYDGIVQQRAAIEKQRNTFLRNVFFCIFAMILVSNGQDISLPILNVSLASIPGLNPLLSIYAAITIFFSCVYGISVGAYTGLMDQFSIKMTGNSSVDPDILSASKAPQQLFLKIFRVRFNTFHPVHIEPTPFSRIVYYSATLLALLPIMLIFVFMYIYVVYFCLNHVGDDWIGTSSKVITISTLVISLYLHMIADWPLKQKVHLIEPTTTAQAAANQSSSDGN
ncbi:MAG: hypothetical protein ACE37M_02400 [Henriciella sp.]